MGLEVLIIVCAVDEKVRFVKKELLNDRLQKSKTGKVLNVCGNIPKLKLLLNPVLISSIIIPCFIPYQYKV